jgi:hypothetical protein
MHLYLYLVIILFIYLSHSIERVLVAALGHEDVSVAEDCTRLLNVTYDGNHWQVYYLPVFIIINVYINKYSKGKLIDFRLYLVT